MAAGVDLGQGEPAQTRVPRRESCPESRNIARQRCRGPGERNRLLMKIGPGDLAAGSIQQKSHIPDSHIPDNHLPTTKGGQS